MCLQLHLYRTALPCSTAHSTLHSLHYITHRWNSFNSLALGVPLASFRPAQDLGLNFAIMDALMELEHRTATLPPLRERPRLGENSPGPAPAIGPHSAHRLYRPHSPSLNGSKNSTTRSRSSHGATRSRSSYGGAGLAMSSRGWLISQEDPEGRLAIT